MNVSCATGCWEAPMLGWIFNLAHTGGDCGVHADQCRQAPARLVLAALTGRACCCRMMGAGCWRFFSNSARSLVFSASSME